MVDNSITRITGFPSGVLQGTITSAKTHAAVAAASISAVTGYPLVQGARKAANGVGVYRLTLAQGQYSVTASAPGYCSKTLQHVLINPGSSIRVDMALEPCLKVFLPSLFKR